TVMNAFTAPLYFSIRFRQACVRSTGDVALLRSSSNALLSVNAVRSGVWPKEGIEARAAVAMPAARKLRLERESCICSTLLRFLPSRIRAEYHLSGGLPWQTLLRQGRKF